MEQRILGLDIAGNPFKWLNAEEAVHYYASDKVIWELGNDIQVFHGGFKNSGERSQIAVKSIIAVRGETKRSFDRVNSSIQFLSQKT